MNRLAAALLLSSSPMLAMQAPEAQEASQDPVKASLEPAYCPPALSSQDLQQAVSDGLKGCEVGLTDQAVQKIVDALSDNARPVAEPQDPPPGPAPGRRVFDSYSEAAQVAQAQDEPLLVSFWMEGCAPCFQLKTIKADPEVSEFLGTNYVVANVNVRTDPATTQQFGVRTVPTEIVRYRSREIGRHGVLGSKQSYLSWHRTVLRRRTGISPR